MGCVLRDRVVEGYGMLEDSGEREVWGESCRVEVGEGGRVGRLESCCVESSCVRLGWVELG